MNADELTTATVLTVKQVQDIYGLSQSAAYRALNEGRIPGAFRLGERSWRISAEAVRKQLGTTCPNGNDTHTPSDTGHGRHTHSKGPAGQGGSVSKGTASWNPIQR